MNFIRKNVIPMLIGFALAMLIVSAPLVIGQTQTPGSYPAGALASLTPNFTFTSTFTATSQNLTQKIPGLSTAAISVSGTALTTVTWQIFCSPDNGSNWFAIPYTTGAVTGTYNLVTIVAGAAITTTSASMYYVNLAGCTQYKISTSSTFTATSVKIVVTASAAKGII